MSPQDSCSKVVQDIDSQRYSRNIITQGIMKSKEVMQKSSPTIYRIQSTIATLVDSEKSQLKFSELPAEAQKNKIYDMHTSVIFHKLPLRSPL